MHKKQSLWGFFAHTGIIVGMMFVVFFIIDRFNPAMEFLTSEISKWLILLLALCAIGNGLYSARLLFQRQKRQEEKSLSLRQAQRGRELYEREREEYREQPMRERVAYLPAQPAYMQRNAPPAEFQRTSAYPNQSAAARR